MASTTTNKKEITDFLWDWAETNGYWAEMLISKIVSDEKSLLPEERQEVFNCFLQSLRLTEGFPTPEIVKPVYNPTNRKIEIVSLSNITGVNKLAPDQVLNFSPNLTVVFGENGTGKTGYSRILKSLGLSYDTNNLIYSDIYAEAQNQSAVINFKSNGELRPAFNWKGANSNSELQNMSIFNNSCVQLSLLDNRQLIVSPIGFHLFDLVTSELVELHTYLNSEIAKYAKNISWIDGLNVDTPQQRFINRLSPISSEQELTELTKFTELNEIELNNTRKELSELHKPLLEAEISNLKVSADELEALKNKIVEAREILNKENWEILIDLNKKIKILENTAQLGLSEIAEKNGIQFYKTNEFQSFINAAENYIKIIDNPDYPSNNDTCVYCLQPLENTASELLKSYRILLNDKSQEELFKLKRQKDNLVQKVILIETNLILRQPIFGLENENPVQPFQIKEYNENLSKIKTVFTSGAIVEDSVFNFNYEPYIQFLSEKRNELILSSTQKKILLGNLDITEKKLKYKIAELTDRKFLGQKIQEVKAFIANLKTVGILNSKASSFATAPISRKTTEARDLLIQQNFNDIFQSELGALRKSNLKIELSFGTERGKSKLWQRMKKSYLLINILSEGEQKAIALAEFLTELQLDNIKAPVIFDDPVNSLDHRIIEQVMKRLIELSKERQVIVFTHSILFLHGLMQQAELEINKPPHVQIDFRQVKSNFNVTGILGNIEELNSAGYYTQKLEEVLKGPYSPNQNEIDLAAKGYGHLRSAIEIAVEDDLLKKTIKRYRKGVAFPALLRIDGSKLDTYKGALNDIYEKCCVSIDGHSSPEEVYSTPSIEELKTDYENFKKIRATFRTQ